MLTSQMCPWMCLHKMKARKGLAGDLRINMLLQVVSLNPASTQQQTTAMTDEQHMNVFADLSTSEME